MCGICGWVGTRPLEQGDAVVRAMSAALKHRGPDGEGHRPIAAQPGVHGHLGHRRLRILDLTEAAHQPMESDDSRVQLVFNGEIYNFRELRRSLQASGYRFRSTGDTEVVLRAYERWGEGAFERLDGMFAIAVWDGAGDALVLARDRVGKKPLFYQQLDNQLTFGSEIKALARAPWVALEPALDQLPAFLAFGYAPWPTTMYRGIEQVPPGSFVRFEPRTGRLGQHAYWSALPAPPPLRPTDDVVAEIRRLVEEATRRRMISDVPVGALLSGGIDSSLVVALMRRVTEHRVTTFSVGFPEAPSFDERSHARRAADHIGTDHTELDVRVDASELLDRLVWLHDGPFGDSSAIPTYLVCGTAREHVTVVLTGDGGDEVFAGYQRFAAAALARLVPSSLLPGLRAAAARLPDTRGYFDARRRLERFAARDGLLEQRYLSWLSIFDPADREILLADGAAGTALDSFLSIHREAVALPPIDRLIHANLRTYLPDDLAVKLDRASMAHSLEARSPLLDTRVIELMSRIPARDKLGFTQVKPLLRRAFGPLLPEETWRRRKHGFGVPVDDWFGGELGARYADEVLGPDGRLGHVLDKAELGRLWLEHRSGGRRNGAKLWVLLTMEQWLRDLAASAPLQEPLEPTVSGGIG